VSEADRPAPLRTIAGHAAAWTRLAIEVHIEADGILHPFPVEPFELYTLAQPEKTIDAAALLREPVIEDPPYWALVWTGARALAAIVSNLQLPPAARVLDLGCGLGLAGLAAARRGAAVTFGDYLDAPLEFVRATLERTHAPGCEVRRIDFTRDDDDRCYDLILAADIVYDPAHYAALAAFLDRHLEPTRTILLTESLRADARIFLEGMSERGFVDEKAALWVTEDGRRERTWLHGLKRAPRSS
jgi:predicted nicotinamide N-methyase